MKEKLIPLFMLVLLSLTIKAQESQLKKIQSHSFSAPKLGTMFKIINLGKDAVEEYDHLLKDLDGIALNEKDKKEGTPYISNLEALQDHCTYPSSLEKPDELLAFSAHQKNTKNQLHSFCRSFYQYAVKYALNNIESQELDNQKAKALKECENNLAQKKKDYSAAGYAVIMNRNCELEIDDKGSYSANSSYSIIPDLKKKAAQDSSYGCDAEFNDSFTAVHFPSLNKSYKLDHSIIDLARQNHKALINSPSTQFSSTNTEQTTSGSTER